jgi:nanoRNase/pAp phosphatase (c-di-AMP/oligoRNAs hydrolase)
MLSAQGSRTSRSDRLIGVLSAFDRFVVVMHDNPDPDAIAAGWGLQVLIEEKLQRPVRLVGGGAIVRAENRHMVELLKPPVELTDDIEIPEGTAALLVDCGSDANNHLLRRRNIQPVAVIDHHPNDGASRPSLLDVRPNVAASATIVASYLREQRLAPGDKLATAMLYAIRAETRGCETHHSALDRSIMPWLMAAAEPTLLAEIENAPLSREYFADLLLAIQSTLIYDNAALCFLPRASGAEIVGEVADLLIRCENVYRVLCAAIVDQDLLLSTRTEKSWGNATELLTRTLDGHGGAGGHTHRAGGKIPGVGQGAKTVDELNGWLRGRWLAACGIERKRGTRLVARREIVENL